MTKSETREIALTLKYAAAGMGPDYLARVLSALHRAARSKKSKQEILAIAQSYGAISHPEFII